MAAAAIFKNQKLNNIPIYVIFSYNLAGNGRYPSNCKALVVYGMALTGQQDFEISNFTLQYCWYINIASHPV